MKYFLFVLLGIATLLPSTKAANLSTLPIAQTKIVGGELAVEGDWPWMSALVFTNDILVTSLDVAGTPYESDLFLFSPTGKVSGTMVDCGIGDSQCNLAEGKICLIERGEIDFTAKALNCEAAGGIGVIIFNNVPGNTSGTLGAGFSGTIPVIAISQNDGDFLLNNLDSIAFISNISTAVAQSATCGASFIGKKWLVTAAHCVEDVDIEKLKVNVGEYDLSDGANNAKTIRNIYIHPDYQDVSNVNNDIALIELVETINTPAISLLGLDETLTLARNNSSATVIGWGNTIAYGPEDDIPANSQPSQLQQVELSLLSNEQCRTQLVKAHQDVLSQTFTTNQVGITDSMICAADVAGGKGSCQGDSGGPLLVNTNNGWQQIGIVSHGVGCATAEFPEVYSRVGQFTQWINDITQGVAINSNYDFGITPKNKTNIKVFNVVNNAQLIANLTFDIVPETTTSTGFSLTGNNCALLAAQQTCQIEVTFNAQVIGQHNIRIVINSNDNNIPTSELKISALVLGENTAINTQLSENSSGLSWFTGGDQPWKIDNSEAAIMSGGIEGSQRSIVLLTFSGEGSLSFDWAVSSEENPDDPDKPFDALYLLIDGQQVDFIAGEKAYRNKVIDDFSAGDHQVSWIYEKDILINEGADTARLRNVIFTPSESTIIVSVPIDTAIDNPADEPITEPVAEPVTPITTVASTTTESSGGSLYMSLLLFLFVYIKRQKI